MNTRESALPDGRLRPIITILIVDDDSVNRMVLTHLLIRNGYSACEACNGAEALDVLSKRIVDMVLMDVAMPIMDGLTATRRIRASERGTDLRIPIIGISAHVLDSDLQEAMQAGMDAYLAKPIDTKGLFRTISTLTAR